MKCVQWFLAGMLTYVFLFHLSAFASVIGEHDISVFLSKDGSAIIKARVKYKELTTEDVPYFMMVDVRHVDARSGETHLNCTTHRRPYGTYISCKRPDGTTPLYNYTVEFDIYTSRLVIYRDGVYRFLYNYAVMEPTKKIVVVLYLPEGYALLTNAHAGEKPYYPQNGITGSDGRHLTITWTISSPKLGETLTFSALYEYVGIVERNITQYYSIIPALLLILIYFLWRKKKSEVMTILTDDERAVIEVLKNAGNKMLRQKDIVKATNFSKAKVSRLLAELEERGLVKRERVGRTNKVKLLRRI